MTCQRARSHRQKVTNRPCSSCQPMCPKMTHEQAHINGKRRNRINQLKTLTRTQHRCKMNCERHITAGPNKRTQFSTDIILPKNPKEENPCWLTVGVTRWWAGRDNAILMESTPSHAKRSKTRRLPPVGCTPCWAELVYRRCSCMSRDRTPSTPST